MSNMYDTTQRPKGGTLVNGSISSSKLIQGVLSQPEPKRKSEWAILALIALVAGVVTTIVSVFMVSVLLSALGLALIGTSVTLSVLSLRERF